MPKLTVNEMPIGFTDGIRFDWNDLNTTGFLSTLVAANQRIIGTVPKGAYVDLCVVSMITADAGASNITIDVGVTGSDPDEFIDNLDLDGLTQAAVNTGDALLQSTTGATLPIRGYINNTTATVPVYMEVNGTHADLTAGEWVVAWRVSDPNLIK
jgi:hypothetical protein